MIDKTGEEFTNDESIALYAVWVETEKVAVMFDIGDADGEFDMLTVNANTGITISSEIPSKRNYIFKGWKKVSLPNNTPSFYNMSRTVENQARTVYNAGEEYVAFESTVFRALFEEGVKITSKPYNNRISLNEISYQLTFALDPTMYGADIQWSSSNFKVASVTKDGIVNLKTPGQTTITVTATVGKGTDAPDVCTDSFVLSVFPEGINNVNLKIVNKPSGDFMAIGCITELGIELDFSAENIMWESQNLSVATISSDGVLTPISKGQSLITATVMVGSYENAIEYTDSFLLTVEEQVFFINDNVDFNDDNVKNKVLNKMHYYYYTNNDIHTVVDEQNLDTNTCIFAFEGLGEGFGQISEQHPKGFLNAMMVVTKGKEIVYVTRRASTLPDNRPTPERHTVPIPRIYSYSVDDHNRGEEEKRYIALVPNTYDWMGWYGKINKEEKFLGFVEKHCSAINLHATQSYILSKSSGFSEGCQTVYYDDYVDFGKAVGFLDDEKAYTTDETIDIGLGKYMKSLVGKKVNNDRVTFPKEVKYVLDRTYDVQNNFYTDQSKFDEFSEELSIINSKNDPSDEDRKKLLETYLQYNSSVDVSYRLGIFYPVE